MTEGDSSSNIIFWEAFQRMRINEDLILPVDTSLHAFNGAKVKPFGMIVLPVYAADKVIKV